MATNIFLSHSTKDLKFTERLEADLRAAGAIVYRVSADQPGEFQELIDAALSSCEWVVLVLTKEALSSSWVRQEVYAANRLKNQGRIKNIIPIQAGHVNQRDIPALWGVYNIFDATADYAKARDQTLHALGLPPLPPPPDDSKASGKRQVTSSKQALPPMTARPPTTVEQGPNTTAVRVQLPPTRFPTRLANLGFVAYGRGAIEYILPPPCEVQAGEFLMGSDPTKDEEAYPIEIPQHRVTLPGFQIARYPVTVAEYACFVRAGQKEPGFWQQQLETLDHPVVCVSWHDAVAYAAWLTKVTGQLWRLPSEAEWEKAARWDRATRTALIYPWGERFDATRANTNDGGHRATTPVGAYPSGASPCGAQEMAGNVWEWTSSLYRPYPYVADDGREQQESSGRRVVRGGSWNINAALARTAYRDEDQPDDAVDNGGFRLVRVATNP